MSIDWPSARVTTAFLMSERRPTMPRKRLVLPFTLRVLTLVTLTLNSASTAAAISSLDASPATWKTPLFCSPGRVPPTGTHHHPTVLSRKNKLYFQVWPDASDAEIAVSVG